MKIRPTVLKAAALAALIACPWLARAESQTTLDVNDLVGDRAASAGVGYEDVLDDGTRRILVQAEFYGVQLEGDLNQKRRLFWLQTRLAKALPNSDAPRVDTPEMYEVSLVPYTSSSTDEPTVDRWGYMEEEETHHQFGGMKVVRDIRLGVGWGFRIRPYTYVKAGNSALLNYFMSVDLLGYGFDSLRQRTGGEIGKHYLHLIAFDGGLRLTVLNAERVRLIVDVLRFGTGFDVPLNKTEEEPGRSWKVRGGMGLSLGFYRSDLKALLGELKLFWGGEYSAESLIPPTYSDVKPKRSSGGIHQVNATLNLYFE